MQCMKIVTCIKCVPYTVSANFDGVSILRDNVGTMINPADMFAIEEAIRFKERVGASSIGICMGVMSTKETLKSAIAMGLDDVYLMSDKAFAGSDTLATSYSLARGIESLGNVDLIICGKQSTDGDTGQVPQEIAGFLNLPCLTNVVKAEIFDDRLQCTILSETGYRKFESPLPAVISVLKGINTPRIPTVKGIIKAQSFEPTIFSASSLGNIDKSKCGLTGSPTRVKKMYQHKSVQRNAVDISNCYHDFIKHQFDVSKRKDTLPQEICDASNNHHSMSYNPKDGLWVVCEAHDKVLLDISMQLLTKANELSKKCNRPVTALSFSSDESVLECIGEYGANSIVVFSSTQTPDLFDERVPDTIHSACIKYHPYAVLFGSTTWGRWIAPFVAVKQSTGLTADCFELDVDENDNLIQTRIAFGGNIIADIICPHNRPQMSTVRHNIFEKKRVNHPLKPTILNEEIITETNRIREVECGLEQSSVPAFDDVEIIIAGGKGIGSKENFKLLFEFAGLVGGVVGASRYAVDAGWIDYSHQIGQTGSIIRPKLYLAFGISGAIEHLLGMRESDCIISINKDRNAPIIKCSDYVVFDDCVNVLTNLIGNFKRRAIQ